MANKDFIELDYYDRYAFRNSSTNQELLERMHRSSFIRFNCFLEIGKLETHKIYKSSNLVDSINVSHCYLNRLDGLGINGISADIYLTEESYIKLTIALGL